MSKDGKKFVIGLPQRFVCANAVFEAAEKHDRKVKEASKRRLSYPAWNPVKTKPQ